MERLTLDFSRPWAILEQRFADVIRNSRAQLEIPETPAPGPKVIDAPGGTRIIQIEGILFRRDNWMTEYFGCTSYDWIYDQVSAALNDVMVRNILLMINSPGGDCDGCFELAEWLRESSGKKEIHSYVQSLAASAAYEIACSGKKITVGSVGYVGSIGVIACVNDYRRMMSEIGIDEYVFVSSVSPKKNPDPATDPGKIQIQGMVDEMGQIFVDSVAKLRSIPAENVAQNFGQGAILIGSKALSVGMCDAIGNLQAAIEGLRGDGMSQATAVAGQTTTTTTETVVEDDEENMETAPAEEKPDAAVPAEDAPAEDEEDPSGDDVEKPETDKAKAFAAKNPTLAASLMGLGASEERKRIQEIEKLAAKYPYHKELIQNAKFKSKMTPGDFAIACINASQANANQHVAGLDKDAQEVPLVSGDSKQASKEDAIVKRAAEGAKKHSVHAKAGVK